MGLTITGNKITGGAKAKVVDSLPDKGSSNSIYLIPNKTTGDNKYDEYIWIKDTEHPEGYFEKVGQRDIDLEPYATKEYVDGNFFKASFNSDFVDTLKPIRDNNILTILGDSVSLKDNLVVTDTEISCYAPLNIGSAQIKSVDNEGITINPRNNPNESLFISISSISTDLYPSYYVGNELELYNDTTKFTFCSDVGFKYSVNISTFGIKYNNDPLCNLSTYTTIYTYTHDGQLGEVYISSHVDELLDNKVDKVEGKGLSSNDFTDTQKTQLESLHDSAKTSIDTPVVSTDTIKTTFHSLGHTAATTITYPAATTTTAGVMSASDKVKVDSIDILASTINHVTDTISSSYYSKTDVDKKLELEAKANTTALENTKEELNTKIDQSLSNKADKTKVSTTADGLMSKEDKILFDKLKSVPALSHINDDNAFTASKTGVTLNYKCYDYTQWGLSGTSHNTQLPVASSSQAGIITVVDKQKLDNFEESLSNDEITEIGGSVITSDNISVDSRINNLQTQVDKNTKAIEKLSPKEQLFIDLWNSACGSNGKYNTETGYYELNGLTDITYDEALLIYLHSSNPYPTKVGSTDRTNLVRLAANQVMSCGISNIAAAASKLEIFRIPNLSIYDSSWSFMSCGNLTIIIGDFTTYNTVTSNTFRGCIKLTAIHMGISGNCSVSFQDSPLLTYDSIKYTIEHARNTSAITITVHPTTYAYLTGTTAPTTQVGGTTEEWQALVTAATAKKISFATTN